MQGRPGEGVVVFARTMPRHADAPCKATAVTAPPTIPARFCGLAAVQYLPNPAYATPLNPHKHALPAVLSCRVRVVRGRFTPPAHLAKALHKQPP